MGLRALEIASSADDVQNLLTQAADVVFTLKFLLGTADHLQPSADVVHEEVQRFEPLIFSTRKDAAAVGAALIVNRAAACNDSCTAARIFNPLGVGLHQIELDWHERTDAHVPFTGRELVEKIRIIRDRRSSRYALSEPGEGLRER